MTVLASIYEHFIPESLTESLDDQYRARTLILVAFLGASILCLFVTFRYALQGAHPYIFVLTATILGVFSTPWIMKNTASFRLAGIVLTGSCLFGFAAMAAVDGGTSSPSLFGLPVVPIFAIFFGNLRTGLIMTCLLAILLAGLALMTANDLVMPGSLSEEIYVLLHASSAAALIIILFTVAYLFIEWQRVAREQLMVANAAKDEFLSGMSHELRTPLNSVMGFTEILMAEIPGDLNDRQKEQLEYIYRGSEHLLDLVEDLVNVTNLDAGKIEIELAEMNLNELMQFCLDSFKEKIAETGISVEVDHGDAPETIVADETRIRQILLNLLSNSFKFSPEGEVVRITMRCNGPVLEIKVSDAGPGIEPEHRNQVFEKFFQVHSALAGKTVGSGLGLYIARRLAQLHGGRLHLTVHDLPGTTFVLILPINPGTPAT